MTDVSNRTSTGQLIVAGSSTFPGYSSWGETNAPVFDASEQAKHTVLIKKGSTENGVKGKTGKVLTVYRRRWCIHVEKVVKDKKNGSQVQIPVDPSNCEITQLKLDKNRKSILARKGPSDSKKDDVGDMN